MEKNSSILNEYHKFHKFIQKAEETKGPEFVREILGENWFPTEIFPTPSRDLQIYSLLFPGLHKHPSHCLVAKIQEEDEQSIVLAQIRGSKDQGTSLTNIADTKFYASIKKIFSPEKDTSYYELYLHETQATLCRIIFQNKNQFSGWETLGTDTISTKEACIQIFGENLNDLILNAAQQNSCNHFA